MTVRTNLPGATDSVLQETIGVYASEAYTNAKKLSGTELVSGNTLIDTETETFVGQLRWQKPLQPVINVASLTNSAAGTETTGGSEYLKYVKTVRTTGASQSNVKAMVSGLDVLKQVGDDFGETRMQDEHNGLLAVMKGVAISEALYGAASASGLAGLGGQTFENDPTSKRYGFYVDLGSLGLVEAATAALQGSARSSAFLDALGKGFKDYEPEYAYLVISPAVLSSLRQANLVNDTPIQDGNISFSSILNGKFRLISTRASQGLSSTALSRINGGAGVDIVGTKTSFIVLPGSLAMEALTVPNDTEITRDGAAYKGAGKTSIWHRWGHVIAPAGYSWAGSEDVFPSDADYSAVWDSVDEAYTTIEASNATNIASISGTWSRKATSALSLGILPIFHG